MTGSIQGFGPMAGMQAFQKPSPLTDEQKSQIQTILSNYDPDNVSAQDAQSIFQSFRDAGIRPGPGLKEAISAAGFDAEALRSLGKPQGSRPPGPPPGAGNMKIDVSALESLKNILSQYDLTNLSEDDQDDMLGQLNQAGLMQLGMMIDMGA